LADNLGRYALADRRQTLLVAICKTTQGGDSDVLWQRDTHVVTCIARGEQRCANCWTGRFLLVPGSHAPLDQPAVIASVP
jgi:hypothetical protein